MSWVKDAWGILETIATLTKDVERANNEVKELRKDVNSLATAVSQLQTVIENEKATTKLVLDHHNSDIAHLKDSIASKFEVLLTILDGKVSDFEHRFPALAPPPERRRSIKDSKNT